MLHGWKTDNCTGRYLKEIYKRRIKNNVGMPGKAKWNSRYFREYGGQFLTDLNGFSGRTNMGMDGFGGQLIWIDFDDSQIIYVHTVHGDYDWVKIASPVVRGDQAYNVFVLIGSRTIIRMYGSITYRFTEIIPDHKGPWPKSQSLLSAPSLSSVNL